MPIKITVMGQTGRLGSQILARAEQDSDFLICHSLDQADIALDVSSYLACADHINQALDHRKPLIIGTTGHPPENYHLIEKAALSIPILFSPNFSLSMALCLETASFLAKQLKGNCSIEIIEAHHAHKKDAPSGTALALAHLLNKENPPPIKSIREGEIIGDHIIIFLCEGERIELKHQVHSREAFAKGALKAAQFLIDQKPGLYSIKDVLYAPC